MILLLGIRSEIQAFLLVAHDMGIIDTNEYVFITINLSSDAMIFVSNVQYYKNRVIFYNSKIL